MVKGSSGKGTSGKRSGGKRCEEKQGGRGWLEVAVVRSYRNISQLLYLDVILVAHMPTMVQPKFSLITRNHTETFLKQRNVFLKRKHNLQPHYQNDEVCNLVGQFLDRTILGQGNSWTGQFLDGVG